jgi:protein involved in polysaccharide export with SLBB domain
MKLDSSLGWYKFFILFLLCLTAVPLKTQENTVVPADLAITVDSRLLLAFSTTDYPATPGDVYRLFFSPMTGNSVTIELVLDARYQLRVLNMGTINAKGKTYLQVKTEVESLISRNYPLSGPSLILSRIGNFNVTVTGETLLPGNRSIDGLTRVSALLTDLTGKASIRFVQVTDANKMVHVYDTFTAARTGDFSQDPYIRPGDHVYIPIAQRIVQIEGEIFRPGKYELLPGEGLSELVEKYGGGLTAEAVPGKITIARFDFPSVSTRSFINLSWDTRRYVSLTDRDIVTVPNKDINRQAVFFEGAVFIKTEITETDKPESANAVPRIPYYFYPGETLGNASRNTRQYFTEVSDLTKAYVLRNSSQIPVDLERYLFRNDDSEDIPLQSGDVIVIPYRQYYTITGEVAEAGDKPLTSLTRLSALLAGLTAKASTRFVTVTSAAGAKTDYDLFKSRRFGDLSQDPYIRPGDRIHVPAVGRRVSVTGEVFRPGEYELLPGETLKELVEDYAGGFTLGADPGRIRLARINTLENIPGESKVFPYNENEGLALEDRDTVSVGNKIENRPIVFFEGAVSAAIRGNVEETSSAIEGTALLEYPFYEGETLGNAVRAIRNRFIASSDLANAYMIRGGNNIPFDLNQFLYRQNFNNDIALENGDTIIIPFHQYFVLVTGAVKAPGRYPYVPDRMADYYINLAGGRDDLLNNGRGISITDMNNRKLSASTAIAPETMIDIPVNRFTARFNQYGPVITAILSIITTTLSILAVTGVLF